METAITTTVIAVAWMIIHFRRCKMIERLAKTADRSGASVKITGFNPLAVNVEYTSSSNSAVEQEAND